MRCALRVFLAGSSVSAVLVSCLLGSIGSAQKLPTCERAEKIVVPSQGDLAAETIPWRATFREGVLAADASDRPVLVWAMNGHPLGLT